MIILQAKVAPDQTTHAISFFDNIINMRNKGESTVNKNTSVFLNSDPIKNNITKSVNKLKRRLLKGQS